MESGFQQDDGWHAGLWWGLAFEAGDQRIRLERQAMCEGL